MPEPVPAQLADPVRSIRVATTLADRFRALQPTGPTTIDALELAIGEAQQIYPEIWRHLDDARRVLARDRDVSQFDDLRKLARVDLGVTEVEAESRFDYAGLLGGSIGMSEVKAASFNTDGYNLAVAASKALMAVLPEIDFKALAAAEEREIAAAGSLQTSKYVGLVKWAALAAGVVVIGILIHRFATRPTTHEESPGRPARDREALSEGAAALEQKLRQIGSLQAAYAATCDRKVGIELATVLYGERRIGEAQRIENDPCVPARTSCEAFTDERRAHLIKRFGVDDNQPTHFACNSIIAGRPGALVPALAIAFVGRTTTRDNEVISMRGVLAPDAVREIVAFASSPEDSTLAGTGDLDDDSIDELVMAGDRGFIVSRIDRSNLVDILGPSLSCPATVTVERDLREDRGGKHQRVIVTIAPDVKAKKGCPGPGRHFYKLADGKIVAD